MKISLIANTEQEITLSNAKAIQFTNGSAAPVYLKNGETVTIAEYDQTIPAKSSLKIDFGYNNCSNLHLLSEEAAEIEIMEISQFKGIHRGTLTPNTEAEVDFKETPASFIMQNLSSSGDLYFAMDGSASIDGANCIKVPPMTEVNGIKGVQKIKLIAAEAVEYQIIGVR